MRWFLLLFLLFFLLKQIVPATRNASKIYEFPFLIASSILIFIFPSLFSFTINYDILEDEAFYIYIINLIICFIFSILGYKKKLSVQDNLLLFPYSPINIFIKSSIFLFIGISAGFYLRTIEVEGLWSGLPVYILFIARLMRPAGIIIIVLILLRPRWYFLYILLAAWLYHPFTLIFVAGRRSEVFILAISILFPLYLIKRFTIGSKWILPGYITSFLIIMVFPIIREFTLKGEFNKIFDVDVKFYVNQFLNASVSNEVYEGAQNMRFISKFNAYNFGSSFYNEFVQQFVPGGIFGVDFKQSLFLPESNPYQIRVEEGELDYEKFWMFHTGFAETFYALYFFGAIFFYYFGYLVRLAYVKAMNYDLYWISIYVYLAISIPFAVTNSLTQVPTQLIIPLFVFYVSYRLNTKKMYKYEI